MRRLLLFAICVFSLALAPAIAAAQDALPRINPMTGKPFSQASRDAYDAELRQIAEEERVASEVSDAANKRFEELRARNAEQIRKFDDSIDAWTKAHPNPPGATEGHVGTSFDSDTGLPESADVSYFNRWGDETNRISFGPDGKPTGDLTQTQQGKAWETIGPKTPPGGMVERVYDTDFDGKSVIRRARVFGPNGKLIAEYEFNYDGIAWRGETFDPETGLRNGAFEDDRFKPPPRTLGGPLAEPAEVRMVTGICESCRPLANEFNDLVHRINLIVREMTSLSEQHQHAYPPAQIPIRARHAVLAAELAALMPQHDALYARLLDCLKVCRAAETTPEPQTPLIDSPAPAGPGAPAIGEPQTFQPGRDAFPADNRDLQQVIDAAQAYLAAANCEGMTCPVCDCDQARDALQALTDMEAYLRAMEPYMQAANTDHMAAFKTQAENSIANGEQRERTIKAIALHQALHNFGSMLLDVASVGAWIKETLTGKNLDSLSPTELLDKLDSWYEAAKDLESGLNTAGESVTGDDQPSAVADLVGGSDGVNKDLINDTTSTIADAKTVITGAIEHGRDWRKALKDSGGAAALGQIAGRYLKAYSAARLKDRETALDELLRDADAGDLTQARAYIDLQKVQTRRLMLEDALAAITAARAAYVGCAWRACGPFTLTRPSIPSFVEDVPGGTPRLSWGKALPWFNQAINETLPKLKPVAFHDNCPEPKKDEPRTADGRPQLPPPPLARPQFERSPDLELPPSFCSEFERNDYLTGIYNPAAASALRNATVAQEHQARLNALFTRYMQANSEYWAAVRAERDAWEPIAAEATAKAEALRQMYARIMAIPLAPCPPTTRTATGPQTPPPAPPTETALTTPAATTTPKPVKPPCPPKEGRQPINVGPNSRVGSGARFKSKVGGFLAGQAMGALGLGGGGGGGGSDGPDLWTCKIKESEYTVFDDPATGVSLRVGAKRAKGGKLVIFSEIAKSPDKGTFQTAFLEQPSTGETMAPADVGPCDLWGEWKLTVSWTKDTYVDGQHVDHQEGGWSQTGKFSIPGTLSKVDAPDGLWKRMGFSNASNGARGIGMIFNVPPGGGPLTFVIHVTRPKGDPVMTVPFVLTLTEGPGGFVFTKAEDPPCPPEAMPTSTVVTTEAGPPETGQPTEPPATTTRPPATPSAERPPPTQTFPPGQLHAFDPVRFASGLEVIRKEDLARRQALDTARCEGPEAWRAKRDILLKHLRESLDSFSMIVGEGSRRDEVDSLVTSERVRLTEVIAEVEALPEPPPAQSCPVTPPPEEGGSILDSFKEVLVPA